MAYARVGYLRQTLARLALPTLLGRQLARLLHRRLDLERHVEIPPVTGSLQRLRAVNERANHRREGDAVPFQGRSLLQEELRLAPRQLRQPLVAIATGHACTDEGLEPRSHVRCAIRRQPQQSPRTAAANPGTVYPQTICPDTPTCLRH